MDFYSFLENTAKADGIEKIVIGAVITNKNGEILLVKRNSNDFMGGIYEIPGGNKEENENICDTIIREVKEETNLNVRSIISYINQFEYLSSNSKKSRQFNFKVEVENGPILLTEHDTYKWINLNNIENEENISKELKYALFIYKFNENQKS